MEEKLRQKIKEIVEERGLSVLSMSDSQAQNRRLNRQINEGFAITLPTVFDILVKFPNISSEWLLRGEGSKYLSDIPTGNESEEVLDLKVEITKREAEIARLTDIVNEQAITIAQFKADIARRESQLNKLIDILHSERTEEVATTNQKTSIPMAADTPHNYGGITIVGRKKTTKNIG